ncbi:hypothetical protein N7509_008679 [Penicillium cosmopolitanum]|uniref:Centrosomin N-terminal motif 1 domain-containing protein n=1 Tax=Penicillium cosmopolitanum TaxID=1131564 RepID=A0A9W9VN06_9EURO|nr:uncharacterized protein N7509_008679 [Penicillium cosmopolitanum]KAJ5386138.1 hypothetical protein N7509_008679 [Penicillium cosmopolitanum]
MAFPYIDTPRTEIDGNATYLTNGFRSVGRTHLSALDSVENSFHTPSKDNDVIKGFGDGRRRTSGTSKVGTPRAGTAQRSTRTALRHLPTAAPASGEFTPLMKSATKNNFLRNVSTTRGADDPRTPGFLRGGNRSSAHTPGLPAMDMSDIYEEDITTDDPTPLPQVASSSAQSTPMPGLIGRDGKGILGDGQNMTLKEQERIIDRLDKDNWNLKLKIHYLEEQIEKAGPEYNTLALKENTELKVARLTMQRDISRYKKSLLQAEHDLEDYRQQLVEMKERARRKQTDEEVQREMDAMREEIDSRDNELRELREELRLSKDEKSQEAEKLRDEVEDLEASLREKERAIDERDEELEELRENGKESDAAAELQAELDRAKEQIEELQDSLEKAKSDSQEANESARQAIDEKDRAEEDLRELQDEMSNKSVMTKGFSRQLEERAEKLEEEVQSLRQENENLATEVERKTQSVSRLEQRYEDIQQDLKNNAGKLGEDLESARRDRDLAQQQLERSSAYLQEAREEIQRRDEEKELLQTRHHALTDESGGLQSELARAQSRIRELQSAVEEATNRAQDTQNVRWQQKVEVDRLQDEIEALQHEIEDKEGHFALEQDRWESTKRTLQSQKDRAEEQAMGYKRTVERLQETEHTLSGKEYKLQEAIDSEKQRHTQEEAVLSRQIKDLDNDLSQKRRIIDEQRNDLLTVREELRISRREEQSFKDKLQALEDEVVVLQSSLADEQEYAKGRLQKGSSDVENQLQKAIADRQTLRDQLANAHVEMHDLRATVTEIEAERNELHAQLDQPQNADDTTRFDREKLELRRASTRLENELKRLRDDKSSLLEAKDTLEKQLGSEIERAAADEGRLSAEIDRLQDKLLAGSGNRDRELTTAKTKVQRLERRISELETIIENQPPMEIEPSTAHGDISLLRHGLEEARLREKNLLQREADQKASVRTLKSRVADLERDLHGALMNKYESPSLQNSPSNKLHEELRSLRKQLSDAHRSLKETKSKNRDLERAAMKEEDQKDLHELLKSSTLEAESLALKVSERDSRLNELKTQTKDLEALQQSYDEALEKVCLGKSTNKTKHEKEMRGLGKEIVWLRARLHREEKFRRDLAWSKGLMELGERVRVACNEADLRLISEMGVQARDRTSTRTPRSKFRSAISMVVAAVRMQRMGQEWRRTKKIGEGLKRAKSEMLKRRESSNRSLLGQ